MVSVYFFDSGVHIEAGQYLRNFESRIVKEKKKIEAESDVQANGFPGREYKIRSIGGYEILRLFIHGSRVFEVKWVAANWSAVAQGTKPELLADEQRFMNSFKILDNAR